LRELNLRNNSLDRQSKKIAISLKKKKWFFKLWL